MLLLKLPSVFRTLYFTPSTAAIMSLAVVLPTLPVTPTKGMGKRSLYQAARSRRARWVSFTLT